MLEANKISPDREAGGMEATPVPSREIMSWSNVDDTYEQILMEGEAGGSGDEKEGFWRWVGASPDGRFVVAGSLNGNIYYRDMLSNTKEEGTKKVKVDEGRVEGFTFLPGENIIYVGMLSSKVCEIDLSSGEITRTFKGHTGEVPALGVSPDGKTLVTGSFDDKTARIWDLTTKKQEVEAVKVLEVEKRITAAYFTVDGKEFCLAGGLDGLPGFINIYDATSYERLAELNGHTDFVYDLAFSRNGKTIYSASGDATVKVWEKVRADQGPPVLKNKSKSFRRSTNQLSSSWTCRRTIVGTAFVAIVSLSPCGKYLATGCLDNIIRVWDVVTGTELRAIQAGGVGVQGVSFEEGGRILYASQDYKVKLFNLATKGRGRVKLTDHKGMVRTVGVSADGTTAVSGGEDGKVHVWDVTAGKPKLTLDGHTEPVASVAVSKDGTLVLSGSDDKTVRMWRIQGEKGEEQRKVEFGGGVSAVAFAASDESSFFAGGGGPYRGAMLKRFSVETGEEMKVYEGHLQFVDCITVTSDGKSLVTGSWDNTVIVWDVESGDVVWTLKGHSNNVLCVAITPNDEKIISGSADNTAKLWSMEGGELLYTFEDHTGFVSSVAIHPSGEFFATGSSDKTWKLWNLESNMLLYTANKVHTDSVRALTFSPNNGNTLISGSDDKTVIIEDIQKTFDWPSSFFHEVFSSECLVDYHGFDWDKSDTMKMVRKAPLALNEPCRHDKHQNLIHSAALKGRGDFLSCVLSVKDDGTADTDVRQKMVFGAVMARSTDGRTPLALALEKRSSPVIKELFSCLRLLFSPKYSLPFTQLNEASEVHLQESFDISELCLALKVAPELALSFVSQLSFVSTGDVKVQEGVATFDFNLHHSSLLVSGSKHRSPPCYWTVEVKRMFGEVDLSAGEPVTAKICPLKGIASRDSSFLESLLAASASTNTLKVFENEVVKAVITHKWYSYVKPLFLRELGLYLALVLSLTLDATLFPTAGSRYENNSPNVVLTAITLCLYLYFVRKEIKQVLLAKSLGGHYLNFWNGLDLLYLGAILLAYGLRAYAVHFSVSLEPSKLAFASVLPFIYIKTLYYMQGFDEKWGQLVRMAIGIINGVTKFIIILVVCMTGFAASFFVLFEGQRDTSSCFNDSTVMTPQRSVLFSYSVMLAGFTLEDIEGSANKAVLAVLLVTFTLFINIVMLNLLIAIMGDIFDRIQENADAEFLLARAQTILEIEGTLSGAAKKSSEKHFPTYLQVLTPSLQSEDTDWQGKIRVLKAALSKMEEKQADYQKKMIDREKQREKKRAEAMQRLEEKLEESEAKRREDKEELKQLLEAIASRV